MLAGSRAALRYLLPACAFVIFFGCATVQELITTPVPPDADPDATALVILACEVTEFLEDLDVVGALLGLDEEVNFKEAVMRDDHGFEYSAYAKDNIVAFERLRPGRHVLIEVTAEYHISTEMGRVSNAREGSSSSIRYLLTTTTSSPSK